ncbi:hypothetical protein EJB05_12846, partial [Eragrostis curvula]
MSVSNLPQVTNLKPDHHYITRVDLRWYMSLSMILSGHHQSQEFACLKKHAKSWQYRNDILDDLLEVILIGAFLDANEIYLDISAVEQPIEESGEERVWMIYLRYRAKGDHAHNVGVDSEYMLHRGIPMLSDDSKGTSSTGQAAVRWRSFKEMQIFNKRWVEASMEDKSWTDPYAAHLLTAISIKYNFADEPMQGSDGTRANARRVLLWLQQLHPCIWAKVPVLPVGG